MKVDAFCRMSFGFTCFISASRSLVFNLRNTGYLSCPRQKKVLLRDLSNVLFFARLFIELHFVDFLGLCYISPSVSLHGVFCLVGFLIGVIKRLMLGYFH